jgi:hypothetical protein
LRLTVLAAPPATSARRPCGENQEETTMAKREGFPESDPRHHTARLKEMLREAARHAREDVEKVNDPKAMALVETSAEVLLGLITAYEHFESRSEPAWE